MNLIRMEIDLRQPINLTRMFSSSKAVQNILASWTGVEDRLSLRTCEISYMQNVLFCYM